MSVRTMGRALAALTALAFTVISVPTASFADQPKTPQPVAAYFAQGLVPRLIDLYGAGNGVTKGIDFDATTKVGGISRVREWTPDFLAGKPSDDPTRLTNNWIAPVSLRGEIIGLATVWINPADDQPELASFDPADLARQLASAPDVSSLVHDPNREAWFALTADALIPLVPGTSGVTQATTTAAYQRAISGEAAPVPESGPTGVSIAALVLGIVIVGLAVFVLLPVKKKKKPQAVPVEEVAAAAAPAAAPEVTPEVAPEVTPEVAPEPKAPIKVAPPKVAPPRVAPPKVAPKTKAPIKSAPAAKVAAEKQPNTRAAASKPAPSTKAASKSAPSKQAPSKPAAKTKAASKPKSTSAPKASGARKSTKAPTVEGEAS